MNLTLSVVIPTHLKAQTLFECVRSVSHFSKQQSLNLSLIIVDNSGGRSKLALGEFSHGFCEIDVIQSSRGVNSARNAGLLGAKTDIVLFLDDDCVIQDSDFLGRHLEFHRTHPEAFAAGGDYLVRKNAGFLESVYVSSQREWLLSGRNPITQEAQFLLGGNFSLKRDLAMKSRLLFDEAIVYGGSETEFFVHAKNLGLKCFYINASISHDCQMSLVEYLRKAYKQGQGKAYREIKWGSELCRSIYINPRPASVTSLASRRGLLQKLQNFIFQRGYRNQYQRRAQF